METNNNTFGPEHDEELGEGMNFEIPRGTRVWFTWFAGFIIVAILGLYGYLLQFNPIHVDPSKFGFPIILLTAIVIITFVNIPWHALGFRVKRIGMVELEQVVKRQAVNKSNELADLQKQIDELKSLISKDNAQKPVEHELDDLVLKFLSQYNQWAFSALRIKRWGGERPGFEMFGDNKITTTNIRESLRRLLADRKVVARISKKGNTIYKVK